VRFQVYQHVRSARWVVRRDNAIYGAYLDKEQAVLDAIDAAGDAREAGCEAQVWVHDQAGSRSVPA